MKISVVIPAYNAALYIGDSIDSVLRQTRQPDEVIVVDDGSDDATPVVLAGFGDRITVLRQEQSGPARALNLGLAGAAGDVFAFQDADDLWVEDKLERQCAVLAHDPRIDAVFGAVQQFVSPDVVDAGLLAPAAEQPGRVKGTMLIRRAAFDRVGPFDQAIRFVDFSEWYGRAVVIGLRSHMLTQVVMLRRLHATNTGRVHRDEQRSEQMLALKRSLDLRRRLGRA